MDWCKFFFFFWMAEEDENEALRRENANLREQLAGCEGDGYDNYEDEYYGSGDDDDDRYRDPQDW